MILSNIIKSKINTFVWLISLLAFFLPPLVIIIYLFTEETTFDILLNFSIFFYFIVPVFILLVYIFTFSLFFLIKIIENNKDENIKYSKLNFYFPLLMNKKEKIAQINQGKKDLHFHNFMQTNFIKILEIWSITFNSIIILIFVFDIEVIELGNFPLVSFGVLLLIGAIMILSNEQFIYNELNLWEFLPEKEFPTPIYNTENFIIKPRVIISINLILSAIIFLFDFFPKLIGFLLKPEEQEKVILILSPLFLTIYFIMTFILVFYIFINRFFFSYEKGKKAITDCKIEDYDTPKQYYETEIAKRQKKIYNENLTNEHG